MTRTFTALAALTFALLVAAFGAGLVSWLARGNIDLDLYVAHYVLGLAAALAVLLTHCLVITYFLGTGRWVKEVCIAYGLPDHELPRMTRDIKRQNTPRCLLAMGIAIATAAAGEATQHQLWPGWIHLLLAVASLAVNPWVFVSQYRNLALNARIIDQVMSETDRIRAERGLPTNEEAWSQEQA